MGADVSTHGWDGLVPLMRHNVIDENALADFTHVMAWLRRALPATPIEARPPPPEMKLTPAGTVETPFWFGPKLFGVLSRPAQGATDQVLLIGNGGRDPHYGAARQNVDFARYLARHGIACLRFDFAGLGDSIGPPGKENLLTHTFTDRLPDIRAALDALEADHAFLLEGDVFTRDFLEMWVARKRQECDALRVRPHPYEFFLYYDA